MVAAGQRPLSLRGRGGGRGRGRGREGTEPPPADERAAAEGAFKLDAAVEFLGLKYQKALDSGAAVYRSNAPAWGANATMRESTSAEAFLKMLTSAVAAAKSKS
mmetsp:Transcript_4454/g.11088  ORF Transcript_4454/g.11088 Transcript_4454/m.11088 type:complete len:104 (-) Transcript_4454:207-518(-)